jgi:hypothetical protein
MFWHGCCNRLLLLLLLLLLQLPAVAEPSK